MKQYVNGQYVDLTLSEERELQEIALAEEKAYWDNISYDEAVNNEIRKRYTESQEFAILRQKDEKPTEYKAYFDYCEECKNFVKNKQGSDFMNIIKNLVSESK